jgi:hypothetical protein
MCPHQPLGLAAGPQVDVIDSPEEALRATRKPLKEESMRSVLMATAVFATLALQPATTNAQSSIEDAVRQTIEEWYRFGRENLRDMPGTYSRDGSLEFWSSGGLLQELAPNVPPLEYVFETRTAKHIRVTPLGPTTAVVHMYVEGGYQEQGEVAVTNYLTRAMLVLVLEGGQWVTRAAHWSPIVGGTGTNQTAPKTN